MGLNAARAVSQLRQRIARLRDRSDGGHENGAVGLCGSYESVDDFWETLDELHDEVSDELELDEDE